MFIRITYQSVGYLIHHRDHGNFCKGLALTSAYLQRTAFLWTELRIVRQDFQHQRTHTHII